MKTVTTSTLLATSGTVAGIQAMLNKFYVSDAWRVDPETLAISHPTKHVDGIRVIRRGKRYRLEFVRTESAAL